MHPNWASKELHAKAMVLDAYLYPDDELFTFVPEEFDWGLAIPMERRKCIDALYNLEEE